MKSLQLTKKEIVSKILNDPDFINSKRYKYSIKTFKEKGPDKPLSDNSICGMLCLESSDEVQEIFEEIIMKARQIMGIDLDSLDE